jgi:hypothetical protein
MKNLVGKFAFSTCSLRMQQMMASRKLFREWDKKLHQPHEPEEKEDEEEIDPAAGVYVRERALHREELLSHLFRDRTLLLAQVRGFLV